MLPKLLIHPDQTIQRSEVEKILTELNLKKDDPDLLLIEPGDKGLGVEDTKKIKQHFKLKPIKDQKLAVILGAECLSTDAQNSLLKILEEPPKNCSLILTASSENNLLPTILSRCQVTWLPVVSSRSPDNDWVNIIDELLKSGIQKRFTILEGIEDKEELLKALNSYINDQLRKNPSQVKAAKLILEANQWAQSNVNVRAILEYLLLSI